MPIRKAWPNPVIRTPMPPGRMVCPLTDGTVVEIELPAPATIEEFDRISREFCAKYGIPHRGLAPDQRFDAHKQPVVPAFHERPYIPPPVVVAAPGPVMPITVDLFA